MTSDKKPSTPAQRKLAWISVGMLCVGLVIFSGALISGNQGTILSLCPVGLLMVLGAFVLAAMARRTLLGKIVIGLGIAGLIVGALILAWVLLLAIGFSNMR